MNGQVCILDNGRRVKFSLKKRRRDPFYLVAFRGPDGKRIERSTKEENKKRASDGAVVIIREEFASKPVLNPTNWDKATDIMIEHMRARNLRPGTISDYKINVNNLKKQFPRLDGPHGVTPQMAEQYKMQRLKDGKSIQTVKSDLIALRVLYGKWWGRIGKIVDQNPFAGVEPPKVDRRPPRFITSKEQQDFFNWLSIRWHGWRFPLLFLEVKSLVGCRITELASAPTTGLKDQRIKFEAETTKGRKQRSVKIPQTIFEELQKIAGPTYVFEGFSQQLRGVHLKRDKPHHARCVKKYAPHKLKHWIEREAADYFKTHPEVEKFKLHNFRGTAMSKARMEGISFDDASVAFGCHPETMRQHYIVVNEVSITDRVMDLIQAPKSGEKNGE